MIATICDFCHKQINGEYMHAFTKNTDGINTVETADICKECWKAFSDIRMIPPVNFPNTEADNE